MRTHHSIGTPIKGEPPTKANRIIIIDGSFF